LRGRILGASMRAATGAACIALVVGAAACSRRHSAGESSAENSQSPIPMPAPVEPMSPPVPYPRSVPTPPVQHNYDFREGSAYGYVAGLSEEERRTGRAAGDVLMFRYRGMQNGRHVVEQLTPDGRSAGMSSCADPCHAIRSGSGSNVHLTAYNPASIIGSVFEDAIAGRLVVAPTRVRRPPDPVPADTEQPSE